MLEVVYEEINEIKWNLILITRRRRRRRRRIGGTMSEFRRCR